MLFSTFLQTLLLFSSFFNSLGQAADNANDNLEQIWNIDQSCNAHKDTIKKAYKDAVIMVQAAISDLETLAQDPPPRKAKLSEESQNFERAKRLIYFIFGIKMRVREHDEEGYLASVTKVFKEMNKAFTDGSPVPEKGYSGKVDKPMLLCGDGMWNWVGLDAPDPLDPAKRPLSESRKDAIENAARAGKQLLGSWTYQDRIMLMFERRTSVGICPPDRVATSNLGHDWITLCDLAFQGAYTTSKSAVERGPELKDGDNARLHDFGTTLSHLLIHEFAHYYGGRKNQEGLTTGNGLGTDIIIDVQAADSNGELLWNHNGAPSVINTGIKVPASNSAMDGIKHVVRTSKEFRDKANSGPDKGIVNADSYAFYADAAYLKDWEWPEKAIQHALPEKPHEVPEPWNEKPPKG